MANDILDELFAGAPIDLGDEARKPLVPATTFYEDLGLKIISDTGAHVATNYSAGNRIVVSPSSITWRKMDVIFDEVLRDTFDPAVLTALRNMLSVMPVLQNSHTLGNDTTSIKLLGKPIQINKWLDRPAPRTTLTRGTRRLEINIYFPAMPKRMSTDEKRSLWAKTAVVPHSLRDFSGAVPLCRAEDFLTWTVADIANAPVTGVEVKTSNHAFHPMGTRFYPAIESATPGYFVTLPYNVMGTYNICDAFVHDMIAAIEKSVAGSSQMTAYRESEAARRIAERFASTEFKVDRYALGKEVAEAASALNAHVQMFTPPDLIHVLQTAYGIGGNIHLPSSYQIEMLRRARSIYDPEGLAEIVAPMLAVNPGGGYRAAQIF